MRTCACFLFLILVIMKLKIIIVLTTVKSSCSAGQMLTHFEISTLTIGQGKPKHNPSDDKKKLPFDFTPT